MPADARSTGSSRRGITIEITESAALDGVSRSRRCTPCARARVRISLDDFGTGFSTLTLLHDVAVDEIKLDRSFTQNQAAGRVPIAAAVIHLAQALGMHAVAEGVETRDQAEHLLALGYSAAQGCYFAGPIPADRFTELAATSEPSLLAG